MSVSRLLFGLAGASLVFASSPLLAKTKPVSPPRAKVQKPAAIVEGATPDRVALINACGGHKFETMVETDPIAHRGSKVKICSKPGANDADWVRTIKSAIAQIEQRDMARDARAKLIGELQAEIGKYEKPTAGASTIATGPPVLNSMTTAPAQPSLQPEALKPSAVLPSAAVTPPAQIAPRPAATDKSVLASLGCLKVGQTGVGAACDFFEQNTILAITAIGSLEQGAAMKFRRQGMNFETVKIRPMSAGQTRQVAMPSGICQGLTKSSVTIEMKAPGESKPGATFGPYVLRC